MRQRANPEVNARIKIPGGTKISDPLCIAPGGSGASGASVVGDGLGVSVGDGLGVSVGDGSGVGVSVGEGEGDG